MKNLTTTALAFLAAGIFTSVSILSIYQILIAVPLIYYTFDAVKQKKFQLPKSSLFLIAFTLVAIISLLINLEVIPYPAKNFGRLKYYIYGVFSIFIFRRWLSETTTRTKRTLTNLFLISMIAAALFGLGKFFNGSEERLRGLTDTLRYGYGTAMILLTLLSAILHRKKIESWFNWKLGLIAFVTASVALYFTYNRGSLLAFMCGLPFVLYYYRPKLGLTLGGLAFAGVVALVCVYLFGSGNYNSRFLVNKNNPSDHIRRSQWKAAIIATKERPVLGWGLSNFHSQLDRIKKENNLDAQYYNDAHAHNLFLEISSGTGLLGLLFFLGWILTWGWEIFKRTDLIRAFVFPFGIAFIVGSQFEVTFDSNNASMIFLMYALSSSFQSPLKGPHGQ